MATTGRMGKATAESVACQTSTEATIPTQGKLERKGTKRNDSTQKEIIEISKKLKSKQL